MPPLDLPSISSREALLHLLGAPAGIGLAHVGRRLNGGHKLKHAVGQADDADNGASNDAQGVVVEEDGADENVDFRAVSGEQGRIDRGRMGTYRYHVR